MRLQLLITSAIGWLLAVTPAAAQDMRGYPRIMQGPMVGATQPNRVLLWVRTSGPFKVVAELSADETFEAVIRSRPAKAIKAADYCVTLEVAGLAPDTEYHYRVLVDGELDRYMRDRPAASLRTAPDGPARFRVCIGSCARFGLDRVQQIWHAVAAREPDMFLWMGDNIYGDALDADVLAEEYRRQRDLASFQPVMQHVPQLAIWDDHDFGLNNTGAAHPAKAEALEVFRRYWPNGPFGLPGTPGVFFRHAYAGVDFFMLDCRYHRSKNAEPDGPAKTMLGEAQLEWLMDGLRTSSAPFKVLVCGSGWNSQKGPAGDGWGAFLRERDALFDMIIREKINGVVLFSGDTHVGELNVIRRSQRGGYDLFEFVSSPLAQLANTADRQLGGNEDRLRPAFRLSANVGVVDFDMTAADPVLRFMLVDVHNQNVWEPFELRASELVVK